MAKLFDVKKGKKDSVKDFILDTFQENRKLMRDTYRNWSLNLAWTRGYQNIDFSTTEQQFIQTTKKQPWKQRLVTNLMLPVARRNVAQLLYTRPVWDVIPATTEEEDIQIALLQSKVMLDQWVRTDMDLKLIRVAFWQSICSSGFLKVGWDADKGKEVEVNTSDVETETLKQYMDYMGISEEPKKILANEGELYIDPVPPYNLTFDLNAAVMEESPYSIESEIKSVDWSVEHFGSKWGNLAESKEQDLKLYTYLFNDSGSVKHKGVLIHTIHVKPSKRFKKGIYAIMTNDGEFLKTPGDYPYEHGELPYAHFLEIYDPTSLWGTCAVEQMRPSQARYNKISSGVMEHINLMSNVQWMNPRQSGVPSSSFTNQPGKVMTYNAPYEPKQTSNKPIPAYVERTLDRTRLDIQDTTSSHDVSEAKAEPGIRSGRAVMALQEADDAIKGPVFLWFDTQVARVGRLALQTIAQYSTSERLAEIRGEFNELEIITYTNSDLKGKAKNGNYWKVRVKTYGRQPMSRSAREATVRTLIEMGIKDPVAHNEELLEIMGSADLLSIYDPTSSDRAKQWKEIEYIKNGELDKARVYFGQNHKAHEMTIKKFISSGYWEKTEEQHRDLIIQHLQQHIQTRAIEEIYPQAILQGMVGNVEQVLSRSGGSRGSGSGSGSGGKNRGSGAEPGVRRKEELRT